MAVALRAHDLERLVDRRQPLVPQHMPYRLRLLDRQAGKFGDGALHHTRALTHAFAASPGTLTNPTRFSMSKSMSACANFVGNLLCDILLYTHQCVANS